LVPADTFPEDGCLWVYGVGEDGVPAFTKDGIQNLRQIIADQQTPAVRRLSSNPTSSQPAVFTACSRMY
jgi:hypothetical protein